MQAKTGRPTPRLGQNEVGRWARRVWTDVRA